jgi:lipoate-protein ligase A
MLWRLLRDGVASGPWNMGVDEALLARAARDGTCSLRFYRWDGPWLSFGYAQSPSLDVLEACRSVGVGCVRRATGGRAVLHGCDLTYSISAPSHQLPGGLQASYELACRAWLDALLGLGVRAERSVPDASGSRPARISHPFDCFAAPAADEICVLGRKLVGSAQRRAAGALLQHGSIRLRPDSPAAARASGGSGAGATSLQEVGCTASPEALEDACQEAFRRLLGVRFEIAELTDEERDQARQRCVFCAEDPFFAPAPGVGAAEGAAVAMSSDPGT